MFFLLNVAIGNSPAYIYSLTPFASLEHQTSGFCHTSVSNLVPLLIFIAWIHIASFTSMFFPLKYLTGHRYLEFSETPNQAYFYANFWFCAHTIPAGDSNLSIFFSADATQTP